MPSCSGPDESGRPRVREKICKPVACHTPRFDRYHADLFSAQVLTCWEEYQIEKNIARTIARAA